MTLRIVIIISCFLCSATFTKAQSSSDSTAITATKAWWHAVTFGDTAYVKSNSSELLTVTFNNGRTFDRYSFIRQVAKHNFTADIPAEWSQITQQLLSPETAIITNRIVEFAGKMPNLYRFITVLVRKQSKWIVAAAQSTREIELMPPAPLSLVGNLNDFAAKFLTPGGVVLKTIVRDTSLILIEPSGTETRLEAIGPNLFEIPSILSAGNVRFSFSRDNSGNVNYMLRVAHKITIMKRIE